MKKENLVATVAYMFTELYNYISTTTNLNPKKSLLENGDLFKLMLTTDEKNMLNLVWLNIHSDLKEKLVLHYAENIANRIIRIGDSYFNMPEIELMEGSSAEASSADVSEEIYNQFEQILKKQFSAMAVNRDITRQRNPITRFFAPTRETVTATLLRDLATFDVTAKNNPYNTATLHS